MSDKVIVIDFGSYSTKFGVSGDIKPIEERSVCVTRNNTELFYGNRGIDVISQTASNSTKIATSITNINYNSNNIDDYFSDIIFGNNINNKLDISTATATANEHPMLISDGLFGDIRHRRNILTETLFESFNIPSIYFELSGVLGLYSTSSLNGLIVDIGYNYTSFLPIVCGYHIKHASSVINVAGYHINIYFNYLLRKSGITLHTKNQLQILNKIACKLLQFNVNVSVNNNNNNNINDLENEINCEKYIMPDKSVLQIGNSRYRASELLFAPHLIGKEVDGIQYQILKSINNTDLLSRNQLLSNIILIGGTSYIRNIGTRLVNELCYIDCNKYNKNNKNNKKTSCRVRLPINRNYSAWIGGSVLSSMDTFKNELLITKQQYDEYGTNILYRD